MNSSEEQNDSIAAGAELLLKGWKMLNKACPACVELKNPKFLLNKEKHERSQFLAKHNLFLSFIELQTIKQAIVDGRLLDLVWSRCMGHPSLARALTLALSDRSTQNLWNDLELRTKRKSILIQKTQISKLK